MIDKTRISSYLLNIRVNIMHHRTFNLLRVFKIILMITFFSVGGLTSCASNDFATDLSDTLKSVGNEIKNSLTEIDKKDAAHEPGKKNTVFDDAGEEKLTLADEKNQNKSAGEPETLGKKGFDAFEKKDYAMALKELKPLARDGNVRAQALLGHMFDYGLGTEADFKEAFKWYKLSAEQGNAKAQSGLGWLYSKGLGVSQDFDAALKWFKLSAAQGEAKGQYALGYMYSEGKGVAQSDTEAVNWYRKAAEQGDEHGQNSLAHMYMKAQSYTEAVNWFRKAAEQGNASAQRNAGYLYEEGVGVAQSDTEAVNWYRKAAEQGHANAQLSLADMYLKGKGVAQSDTEAVNWYRKAAEQGDAIAQRNLGFMYSQGRGVAQSDTEAMNWSRKAAEQGDAIAHINAATLLYQSVTNIPLAQRNTAINKREVEAMRLFRKGQRLGAKTEGIDVYAPLEFTQFKDIVTGSTVVYPTGNATFFYSDNTSGEFREDRVYWPQVITEDPNGTYCSEFYNEGAKKVFKNCSLAQYFAKEKIIRICEYDRDLGPSCFNAELKDGRKFFESFANRTNENDQRRLARSKELQGLKYNIFVMCNSTYASAVESVMRAPPFAVGQLLQNLNGGCRVMDIPFTPKPHHNLKSIGPKGSNEGFTLRLDDGSSYGIIGRK
jgi:TPR repeat protein